VARDLVALAQSGVEEAQQILRDDDDDRSDDAPGMRALGALSARLRHGAEMLTDLVWEVEAKSEVPPRQTVVCSAVLRDALSRLSIPREEIDASFEGDATIVTGVGDLAWCIATLLQWFVDRSQRTGQRRCALRFQFQPRGERVVMIVEDESERAPEQVRRMLFEPGTVSVTPVRDAAGATTGHGDDLALYVANVTLDWRYDCKVSDDTPAGGGERGHRFALSFRRGEPAR
jgi:hypothetical protein